MSKSHFSVLNMKYKQWGNTKTENCFRFPLQYKQWPNHYQNTRKLCPATKPTLIATTCLSSSIHCMSFALWGLGISCPMATRTCMQTSPPSMLNVLVTTMQCSLVNVNFNCYVRESSAHFSIELWTQLR